MQLFEDYSVKDMTFNPPVAGPPSKKKVFFHITMLYFFCVFFFFFSEFFNFVLQEHFTIGHAFFDPDLKAQINAALQTESEQMSLDFTSRHTPQET